MSKSVFVPNDSLASVDQDLTLVCLDKIVEQSIRTSNREGECPTGIHGVVIGDLIGISQAGEPLIVVDAQSPTVARSTVALDSQAIGRQVALMFENGRPECPLIIGVIQRFDESDHKQPCSHQLLPLDVRRDDQSLVLTADREIVIRCGEASITLTRAGKILIRGNYVLSRSSGVNRIKGGSVQIN